jgi:hypothetical protein
LAVGEHLHLREQQMRIKTFLGFIFPILIVTACTQNKKEEIHTQLGNGFYSLTPSEIPHLKQEAILGSMEADAKVFNHYYWTTDDRDQAIYWAEIGTEICKCVAGMEYISSIKAHYKDDAASLMRAKFWALKAKELGGKNASYTLQEIDQKLSTSHIVQSSPKETKALMGSGRFAIRLADQAGHQKNSIQELYWVHIAVQNGVTKLIPRLIKLMQQDPAPDNQLRAQFWLHNLDWKLPIAVPSVY